MILAIEKWLTRCELILVNAAVVATAAMMVLTSADAIGRYLFNRPILGAYEITEKYLMVVAVFLGLSYAFRGGAFIRVTFLVSRLPRALKRVVDHVAHLVTLGYCVILLYATAGQALRALDDNTSLTTLPIPLGPAYGLVPLGFLALTVAMLIDLRRVRAGNALLFQDEAQAS